MERVTYEPIGTVHSPFADPEAVPKNPREGVDARGTVEIREAYADGLARVETFSHLVLLSHLHRVEDARLRCDPPFAEGLRPGIFATRGARRPNPIGRSVVRLESVDGTTLTVRNLDLVDGTPLLDIKPHAPKRAELDGLDGGWIEAFTDQDFSRFRD